MTTGEVVQVPRDPGVVRREGFGGTEVEQRAETATTALAAQAKAQIEARYIMARRFPRDLMVARDKLLRDCLRPAFADSAIWELSFGSEAVQGPSIRLAEAAVRALTNIYNEAITVYDDQYKRLILCRSTDLEANNTYDHTITVEKTVERRSVREGQTPLARRMNSNGDPVFVVQATDDQILNKQNAIISKTLRVLMLRHVPGDILEEALAECFRTMETKGAQDPDAEKKRMVDSFSDLGIGAEALAAYLGHPIGVTTPAEITRMRALYNAIKEGATTWDAALERRAAETSPDGKDGKPAEADKPAPAKKKETIADVTAKARAARQKDEKIDPIDLPDPKREPGADG